MTVFAGGAVGPQEDQGMRSFTPQSIFGDIPQRPRAVATVDEERHEVFESIREAIRTAGRDSDRLAACAYLLRHLARTERRP